MKADIVVGSKSPTGKRSTKTWQLNRLMAWSWSGNHGLATATRIRKSEVCSSSNTIL